MRSELTFRKGSLSVKTAQRRQLLSLAATELALPIGTVTIALGGAALLWRLDAAERPT